MNIVTIGQVIDSLQELAPLELAAEWDNVGLLLGDPRAIVQRVLTCLTITSDVVKEAVESHVQLIVTHHPLPFRPVSQINTESTVGRNLWELAKRGIAIFSLHTAFDSCRKGINQQLADTLGLQNSAPLCDERPDGTGTGRWGLLPEPCRAADLLPKLKGFLGVNRLQFVGDKEKVVQKVAVACGSAGELIGQAIKCNCDLMVCGEVSYHRALEAASADLALVVTGHYASEKFAMVHLAKWLQIQFPQLTVWSSRFEKDPFVCL